MPGGRPASGLASLTRIRSAGPLARARTRSVAAVEVVAVGDERGEQPVDGGLVPDRVGVARQRRGDAVAQVGAQPRPGRGRPRERRAVGGGVAQGDDHARRARPWR